MLLRNSKMRPFELMRFHSDYMKLRPGDLISTGCPKGARIKPCSRVRACIEGVGMLSAPLFAAPEKFQRSNTESNDGAPGGTRPPAYWFEGTSTRIINHLRLTYSLATKS